MNYFTKTKYGAPIMKYKKTITAKFIDRPNRFIAHVEFDGKTETVHVKNTGRCKELLIPGSTVVLQDFRGEETQRKTKFDLIAVYKEISKSNPIFNTYKNFQTASKGSPPNSILINMDSQAPNKVVYEYLQKQNYDFIKPEFTFGKSRVDFYMERGDKKFLMEVKGCTLERDGKGFFPDAPTERGVKHLQELKEACAKGYHCIIAFVIQVPGVMEVFPNRETHQEFGEVLEEAKNAGVEVLFFPCRVWEDRLEIIN